MADYGFIFNDGGRHLYFKGRVGDCGCRAAAIITGEDYKFVYDNLFSLQKDYLRRHPSLARKWPNPSPRNFLFRDVLTEYLKPHGYEWKSLHGIGVGASRRVEDVIAEYPNCIMRLRRHFSAVVDGQNHDTWPQKSHKVVYGVWIKSGGADDQ